MVSPLPAILLLTLSSLFTLAAAYSWNFVTPPQQCSNLTVSLTGSGGIPPYRILVMPFGSSPLGDIEVRTVLEEVFPVNSTTVTFQLNYPANSQLVAVVSVTFLQLSFSFFLFLFCSTVVFGIGPLAHNLGGCIRWSRSSWISTS
jgi:hypothetical protein